MRFAASTNVGQSKKENIFRTKVFFMMIFEEGIQNYCFINCSFIQNLCGPTLKMMGIFE